MKRHSGRVQVCLATAAAFGRLCVETFTISHAAHGKVAAAFGRLCVETAIYLQKIFIEMAAAFGRLCVETSPIRREQAHFVSSRLRAAVC